MQKRTRLVFVLLFLGFFAVLGRLLYWQIFQQRKLKILAAEQYHVFQQNISGRGKILASDLFPLVINQNSYLLFADPSRLELSADELQSKLVQDIQGINLPKKLLADKELYWVSLKDNLSEEERNKIESLNINGLGFEEKSVRYYPEASLSAKLLGFLGADDERSLKGYYGIEGYYNKELEGRQGSLSFEKDALGRLLPIGILKEEKQINGRDLVLNINRGLQFLIEMKLKDGIAKYQAASGSVVVMDPTSGAVLAMASFPSYLPEKYSQYSQNDFRNPVISDIFEPGSIFKVVVMAAAIDSNSVKENETCSSCTGPKTIGEYTIKTWNEKYYPGSTMTDIIIHSDNIGMVYVTQKMGLKRFLDYLNKFGLNEKTGIDLEGEVSRELRPESLWSEIDLATASFGQGIALTPIQMLSAVSAIANGGEIWQPQVVSKIIDGGKQIPVSKIKSGRAISAESAAKVKRMMVSAVEHGEAKWAKPKGYQIAGKTGTAQIPIEGHYDPEKTIASFIGFAPADNTRFAMLVVLNEPKSSPWGSETAAPLWFAISKDIFRLLGIPPAEN